MENFIKETDANGDGQVTREELHDYIKKVIANGKEKAPGNILNKRNEKRNTIPK